MAKYDEENQPYIQSQYGASPVIKKILNSFRMEIDPSGDIDLFQRNVMNVNSAQGVGLDIWGNIVGVERTIRLDDGTTVTLDDENFRNYIKFKAYVNISDASLAIKQNGASALQRRYPAGRQRLDTRYQRRGRLLQRHAHANPLHMARKQRGRRAAGAF